MTANTMRTARFHNYGPIEELIVEQAPRPRPEKGQVLVRVHASAVNPIDWKIRMGYLKDMLPLTFPQTPGGDLAGIVEEVGPGVTTLTRGQMVFGRGLGTNAEYAVAPASSLAPMPSGLTFELAASVPLGALTAWTALFTVAGLEAGQRVLVHGAAGGVGLCAVQLARWKGADVVGTTSTANVDYVRSLGAETVIDYSAVAFEDVVRNVDVVLDTIGGETLERSWQALKTSGIIVSVADFTVAEQAKARGRRGTFVVAQASTETLKSIGNLIVSKDLVPEIHQVFSLDDIRQAHALSQTGHGRGRIVLKISDDSSLEMRTA